MFELFGWFALLLCVGMVFVPYVRGKSDLITSWNLLMLSGVIYIGLGVLEVEYEDLHWAELAWFSPTDALKQQFVMGATVFLGSLFFFYYVTKFPQKIASHQMRKWPTFNAKFVYSFLIASAVVMAWVVAGPQIPVVSAIMVNVSHKVAVFAAVFAFVHWWRTKSLFALGLFLSVFCATAMFSMLVFSGRRLLLSVMCIPVICYYWHVLRYRSPASNIMKMTAIAGALLIVSTGYSAFRFFNKGARAEEERRTVTTVMTQMSRLDWESVISPLKTNVLHYGAQYSGYYALLTMRYLEDDRLKSEPLQSLKWIASYPVPRRVWEDKPVTIGIRMVELSKIPGKTNWGVNIVGHGFLEGGYPTFVLYALLAVITVRWLDMPLMRDPDNPFLIATLCTTAPHTVAWMRGDIAIMWTEILEAIVFTVALGALGRLVFGSDHVPRNARHQVSPRPSGRLQHLQ